MAEAFAWGTLAACSLVIGAVLALVFRISLRMIGLIMAFGGGVLISDVSFDVVEEASQKSSGSGWVIAGTSIRGQANLGNRSVLCGSVLVSESV